MITTFSSPPIKKYSTKVNVFIDLYSSKIKPDPPEVYDFFFAGENPTLLNSEEQKLCEGKLTKKECLNSLKDMAPDKSPGTDGLPAEYY